MMTKDSLIEEIKAAYQDDKTHKTVREVLQRHVADEAACITALGAPQKGGVEKLYHAPDLTILNVVWAPYMTLKPHNHAMWAVIGVYSGREDNIFWRRLAEDPKGHIEAAGARSIAAGEVEALGKDIIHSVTNPLNRLTAAIHVYGGDFFVTDERSEWNPESLAEQPLDMEDTYKRFEIGNRTLESVT